VKAESANSTRPPWRRWPIQQCDPGSPISAQDQSSNPADSIKNRADAASSNRGQAAGPSPHGECSRPSAPAGGFTEISGPQPSVAAGCAGSSSNVHPRARTLAHRSGWHDPGGPQTCRGIGTRLGRPKVDVAGTQGTEASGWHPEGRQDAWAPDWHCFSGSSRK
jgi:hypothetical protein